MIGVSTCTNRSIRSAGIPVSPRVLGIAGLIPAMTVRAASAAARDVDGDAEAAGPVRVGRRGLHHGDVDGDPLVAEEGWDVGDGDREVLDETRVGERADVLADVEDPVSVVGGRR